MEFIIKHSKKIIAMHPVITTILVMIIINVFFTECLVR